ncbi:MAG TPA: FKBP-type peptidyl-prolyl cis-trans isomerase [Tenuifilaceae bacterium]|nr:FKBP-type peptidyl-prolyl cis-trans isomerase [Tenuifilaceae bacterium]HPH00838.1 FKBP-type peptidyl-prolyl cis-trans isomerase [Tenuifilaceae bacterium]
MKLNKLLAAAILFPAVVSCQSTNGKIGKVAMKNDTDSISYAIGVMYAQNLKQSQLETVNYQAVARAIQDIYSGDSANVKMSDNQAMAYINEYFRKLDQKIAEKNLAESTKFLDENKTKEGVVVDSTGLQYKIITEGNGPIPTADAVVKVHYKGTLVNGKQFDSSYENGEPAQFKLNQVIRGWSIGLQKMKVGSKFMLYIPADLAYGVNVRPGGPIGPNQALIFEVELLDIVKEEPAKK